MSYKKSLWWYLKNDPVRKCRLYKEQGCCHVDGFLCDFPDCSMNKEYINERHAAISDGTKKSSRDL